jgi:hypothetical protein
MLIHLLLKAMLFGLVVFAAMAIYSKVGAKV